ncbi:MAG: exodeoxyribonuclease VII small subunit [Treponema sp.]|jgi:exodeoxyribonuclease VII small subunit|nr:exodeoxyribonuclease VII small subunit [Treponema sp.]
MSTIEERLKKLENLSDSIKDNELGIEDAMKLFDEGIKLVRSIEKELDAMEGKIQILMNQPLDNEETPQETQNEEKKVSKVSDKSNKKKSQKPELELFSFEAKTGNHE